jgi:hypothetical protein
MTIRKFEDYANSGELQSMYLGGTDSSQHKVITIGDLQQSEDWIAPSSFTNSWDEYDGTNLPVLYKKLKDNIVLLQGSLSSGTVSTTSTGDAFTLPIGYRPIRNQYFICVADTSYAATILILTTGEVRVYAENNSGSASTWTSLSSIHFLAEQ